VTSNGDRVDGFISNLVRVFLDPAPIDVVQIHSPGTSDNTETHRFRSERERSIYYHFIYDCLFLVECYIHTYERIHLRDERSGINSVVCEGRDLTVTDQEKKKHLGFCHRSPCQLRDWLKIVGIPCFPLPRVISESCSHVVILDPISNNATQYRILVSLLSARDL